MKKLFSMALLLGALPMVACSSETVVTNAPGPAGQGPGTAQGAGAAKGTVTAGEGGSVELDGLILEVPAGAVAEDTEITVTKTDEAVPERHAGVTPIYTLEPAGLKLKKAGKLTFTKVPADAFKPTIGVLAKDDHYEGLTTKAAEGAVSASISELAKVFVAKTTCMKEDGNAVADTCQPVPAPATVKSGKTINGFALQGFEYWQWKKPDPYDGGNEVAWGYNGDGEPKTGVMPTDVSRACMAESFRTLEAILTSDQPEELKKLSEMHGVNQFWFWNNDMTDAKSTVKVPKNNSELWLYAGDRGDGGLIKWISQTNRDGTCILPTREDLAIFAKACQTDFPGCGSGK